MNTIAYADDWAQEARDAGGNYGEVREAIMERCTRDTPIYLGIVDSVNYDAKADRYTAKFDSGSAKVTADVAQFLLTHDPAARRSGMRPTVYAHMTEGAIDAVLLLFVSRS